MAEGYRRRSIQEYLNFPQHSFRFIGENVSGLEAYRRAGQISEDDFEVLNKLAYKLENGLLKLVESLERKEITGDWIDRLIVEESNETYGQS